MSDQYETILYEVDDPVAVITLNRPARLNAWTMAMGREVHDAVLRAGADKRVVGVIITGAGRAFCSGGDLKDLKPEDLRAPTPSKQGDGPAKSSGDPAGPFEYMMKLSKPVIAAVNGPAVGMGAVLTLWADLRFMAEEAMYTMAFSQRGTVAESGSSCLLPRLVGPAVALDLLMSSRRVDASEALRIGLVNATAPGAELLAKARQYIVDMAASCSPTSIATMKQQVYADLPDTLGASVKAARQLLAVAADNPDIQEGWKSYLEKRPASFARLGAD